MSSMLTLPAGSTLKRIAERILSGEPETLAIKEFLDDWRFTRSPDAFIERPELTGRPAIDVWLAGAAEALAFKLRKTPPEWAQAPERFLEEPLFLRNSEAGRMTDLVETPACFRRRNLFCGRSRITELD